MSFARYFHKTLLFKCMFSHPSLKNLQNFGPKSQTIPAWFVLTEFVGMFQEPFPLHPAALLIVSDIVNQISIIDVQ